MNERIRELIKQAGGHFYTQNLMSNPVQYRESIELWDKNIERFAELIVRECCQKLENDGMVEVAMEMKQHFGVEE